MIGVIAIDKSIHIWIKLPSHFRIRSGLSIFIFGLNNGFPSWPVWIQFIYRSNGQYNLTMDIADHRLLPWFLRGHANSRATINIKFYSFDIVQIRVVSSLLAPVCSDGWWLCSLVDAGSYYCRINCGKRRKVFQICKSFTSLRRINCLKFVLNQVITYMKFMMGGIELNDG